MKYLITFLFLIVVASSISRNRDKLTLPNSSLTVYTNQEIRLEGSSFSPLYLHVFKYEEVGPMNHVNLTDLQKGFTMRIESFKLMDEDGFSTWLAYLKRDNDDKIYVCELEEALSAKEIKLIK